MSNYCASCLADLALVRDAVTSVNGTAACVAHAVLLTHPTDSPQRRLQRLSELRSMAEGKLATASTDDVPAIELLIQEYALAGAMDMSVPLRDIAGERAPRPPKKRRDRGRDRERGPREFPVETRTSDAGADGAPAPSSELSGSDSAGARPGPDSSEQRERRERQEASAPVPDTSQQPASSEPQPSPEPAPHGDNLLAPEGVNSSSTSGQESPDVPTPPAEGGASGADQE